MAAWLLACIWGTLTVWPAANILSTFLNCAPSPMFRLFRCIALNAMNSSCSCWSMPGLEVALTVVEPSDEPGREFGGELARCVCMPAIDSEPNAISVGFRFFTALLRTAGPFHGGCVWWVFAKLVLRDGAATIVGWTRGDATMPAVFAPDTGISMCVCFPCCCGCSCCCFEIVCVLPSTINGGLNRTGTEFDCTDEVEDATTPRFEAGTTANGPACGA